MVIASITGSSPVVTVGLVLAVLSPLAGILLLLLLVRIGHQSRQIAPSPAPDVFEARRLAMHWRLNDTLTDAGYRRLKRLIDAAQDAYPYSAGGRAYIWAYGCRFAIAEWNDESDALGSVPPEQGPTQEGEYL